PPARRRPRRRPGLVPGEQPPDHRPELGGLRRLGRGPPEAPDRGVLPPPVEWLRRAAGTTLRAVPSPPGQARRLARLHCTPKRPGPARHEDAPAPVLMP